MRLAVVLVLACAAWHRSAHALGAGAGTARDHPIAGVIALLDDLELQAKTESAHELNLFEKFEAWCAASIRKVRHNVKKEKRRIKMLTAKIASRKLRIETLTEQLKTLAEELESQEASMEQVKRRREKENEMYHVEQDNFADTIVAVNGAVDAMESAEEEVLLQVPKAVRLKVANAALLAEKLGGSRHHKANLAKLRSLALLKKKDKEEPPEGEMQENVGEFHSDAVINTFEEMSTDFEEDKVDASQEEINRQNSFNLAKQAGEFAIAASKESVEQKTEIKADKEEELVSDETWLSQEEAAYAVDSVTLSDVRTDCQMKADEWNQRSEVRQNEVKALQMAKKILSKVTGVRNPKTWSKKVQAGALVEASDIVSQDTVLFKQALSLLQVDDPKAKAVNMLLKEAHKIHSKSLEKMAQEIATYGGPFDKIKQMMQKMVFRLMAEQKDEDDQKNWCDVETEKSQVTRDDKEEKVTLYKDKLEEMRMMIIELKRSLAQNDREVEDIHSFIGEETEMRGENKKELKATVKDSQDAQKALAEALAVLTDFYKASGEVAKEPWEFVQKGRRPPRQTVELPDNPDTWDSSYTGVADPKSGANGILTLLDATLQKFSTMEAQAKAAESTDQKNFEKDIQAKTIELSQRKTDSNMKETQRNSLMEKEEAMSASLKHTSTEFDAVEQYLKELEPSCGTADSNYKDRKQARADEIKALKTAQNTLEEAFRAKPDGFMQRHVQPAQHHNA